MTNKKSVGPKKAVASGILQWVKVSEGKQATKFKAAGEWQADLIVTKDIAEKFANDNLIKLRQNKEGEYVLKLKKPCVTSKGVKTEPPIVVHADGYEINPDTVGNGSKGTVELYIYEYNNTFGKGLTVWLNKITVTDLDEYLPEDKEPEDFFGGAF